MSPELIEIYQNKVEKINFDPEKSDLFSLGISFLQSVLLLNENYILGLNSKIIINKYLFILN